MPKLKPLLALLLLSLLVLLPAGAWAEDGTDNSVTVTNASQTIIFSEPDSGRQPYIAGSVLIRIPKDTTATVYFKVFTDAQYQRSHVGITCGDQVVNAACVRPATTNDHALNSDYPSIEWVFDWSHEGGSGYVAISLIATDQVAGVMVDWK